MSTNQLYVLLMLQLDLSCIKNIIRVIEYLSLKSLYIFDKLRALGGQSGIF